METRRAFLTGIRKFELQKAEIEPRPEQVLIKVAVCGLCHYELNHWKGLIGT